MLAASLTTGWSQDKGVDKEKAAREELKRFNGTWVGVKAIYDGKAVPEETAKKLRLVVKDENYTFDAGDDKIEGVHKLSPTTSPKQIDAVRKKGPDKDKVLLGIYELTETTFRVCFAAPGKPRPKAFSSKAGSEHRLIELKREKE